MEGRGVLKYQNGKVYKGDFKNDKRHGLGIMSWPDGRIHQGLWENGKKHGHGKFKSKEG